MKNSIFESDKNLDSYFLDKMTELRDRFDHERTAQIIIQDLIEKYEDAGYGNCSLTHPDVMKMLISEIHRINGEKALVLAFAIMPNHMHILLKTDSYNLYKIVQNLKSRTAFFANKILKCSGPFWTSDYFDRRIRNERHYMRTLTYILKNPQKAHVEGYVWRSPIAGVEHHFNPDADLHFSKPKIYVHSRGYLVHQEAAMQCQFITIREQGSVPKHQIDKWKLMLEKYK